MRRAITPSIRCCFDAGLCLPDGVLVDHRFRGMSVRADFTTCAMQKHSRSLAARTVQATVLELARAKRQKSKPTR